jgi:hypothetical protein
MSSTFSANSRRLTVHNGKPSAFSIPFCCHVRRSPVSPLVRGKRRKTAPTDASIVTAALMIAPINTVLHGEPSARKSVCCTAIGEASWETSAAPRIKILFAACESRAFGEKITAHHRIF